jgi:hypothetical protein
VTAPPTGPLPPPTDSSPPSPSGEFVEPDLIVNGEPRFSLLSPTEINTEPAEELPDDPVNNCNDPVAVVSEEPVITETEPWPPVADCNEAAAPAPLETETAPPSETPSPPRTETEPPSNPAPPERETNPDLEPETTLLEPADNDIIPGEYSDFTELIEPDDIKTDPASP